MDPREVEKRNERKVKAAALIFLVIAVGLTFCIVYFDSLKRMGTDPAYAREWFASRQPYGAVVYVILQALQIIFVVVPGEPFELAAGYAFGAVNGSLLCLLGESIGSVAVLLAVRKFGRKIALLFFPEERLDRLKFLHYSPKRLFIFAVIFMLPASPKALLCYFAGLTDIDIHKLLIICTLGRIPAIVTSTISGSALGDQRYLFAVVVILITAVLSAASIAVYNYICERHGKDVK